MIVSVLQRQRKANFEHAHRVTVPQNEYHVLRTLYTRSKPLEPQ